MIKSLTYTHSSIIIKYFKNMVNTVELKHIDFMRELTINNREIERIVAFNTENNIS